MQAQREDRTGWAALDRISEAELERRIAADPDAETGPIDWTTGDGHPPRNKASIRSGHRPGVRQLGYRPW